MEGGLWVRNNDPGGNIGGVGGTPLGEPRGAAYSPVSGVVASTVPSAASSEMPAGGVKCRKCGRGTDPAGTFCAFCGTRVADTIEEGSCPGCGAGYAKGSDL